MPCITSGALILLLSLACVATAAPAQRTRGTASLGATHNAMTFADSAWSGRTQLGASLRLGVVAGRVRGVDVIPHVQVGFTAVSGVRAGAAFAFADGDIGVQLRRRSGSVHPYVRAGLPLWRTVEVVRDAERRNYGLEGRSDLVRPTLGAGLEIPLCRTGAGLDLAIAFIRGEARSLEVLDDSHPSGSPDRFRRTAIREPYSVRRWYVGYSGPFTLVRPLPGRLC